MKQLIAAAVVSGVFLLGGCSGSHGTVTSEDNLNSLNGNPAGATPPTQKAASTALFQPAAGLLPYPTDLYFAGSLDGALNLPANPLQPNQPWLNHLDGFSTTAVIRENFAGPLNPASFTAASIIIVPVTTDNETKATTGVLGQPLTLGTDFSATTAPDAEVGPTILQITPLHPLMPSTCIASGHFLGADCKTGTGYLVILTNGISDASGTPAVPDTDYALIKAALASGGAKCPSITNPTLNGICQLTGAHLQIAAALGINPADIVLTFSFTTESTADTLELLSATTKPTSIKVNPTPLTTHNVNPASPGFANIYVGVLSIPYYLSKAAPLTGYWHAPPFPLDPASTSVTRYNPLPVPTQVLQIPVLVTVPNASSGHAAPPAGGWPLVIYQHGLGSYREEMFGVADAFAASGFVVAAIDAPLHGITNTADPFYATAANPLYTGLGLPAQGSIERTFDLALMHPPAIDPSGSYFINFQSPLTTRDNFREAPVDLITFERTLPSLNLGAAGTINGAAIHYVGHSGGAFWGTLFLASVPSGEVLTGTLANGGGGISQLVGMYSAYFAPIVNASLAAAGIPQGSTLYYQWFRDTQNVVDSGDPVNYIALATALHPVHLMQVIGMTPPPANCTPNTPLGCPDQIVPNISTQALITASAYGPAAAAGALTRIPAPAAPGPIAPNASGYRAYVNFVNGDHDSIFDNLVPSVTAEMQGEAVSFAASNGEDIVISVPSVIEP